MISAAGFFAVVSALIWGVQTDNLSFNSKPYTSPILHKYPIIISLYYKRVLTATRKMFFFLDMVTLYSRLLDIHKRRN